MALALVGVQPVWAQASIAAAAGIGTEAAQWWLLLASVVALAALAAAGYALGRSVERRHAAATLFAARSRFQALLSLTPETVWRTDAQYRLVPPAGSSDTPKPETEVLAPWAQHPRWSAVLQARRAFADQRWPAHAQGAPATNTTPASAAAMTPGLWVLNGQPLLDAEGQFAGFLGTARWLEVFPQATEAAAGATAQTPQLPPVADLSDAAAGARPSTARANASSVPNTASGAACHSQAASPGTPASAPLPVSIAPVPPAADAPAAALNEAYNFSATVAHDLRAPIRVVDGFTRIIKEDYGPALDRVANDHLDRVLSAAARMTRMIDALLGLANLSNQALCRQQVNLSQLARHVLEELQRAHPSRQVQVHIEEGLLVNGDPTLLRLVLENLLGNAWKYSARTPQAHISLTSTPHATGRAFVVRDNGAGFDMQTADRLFEVFQRLHSASEFPGHGVGLVSARRIVRRHGGDIWAESEPARGAAFSFTLAEPESGR
jgi:signal transduction histidine kinase